MADASIEATNTNINEEDYTGAVCLLVRERHRRRHAKLEALIDADRLADVASYDWIIWPNGKRRRQNYIVCCSPLPGMQGWVLPLHRFLTDPAQDLVVDHKNRIGSDNRLQNLRICTPQQNSWNATPTPTGGSKYKGVTRRPGRRTKRFRHVWKASISIDRKTVLIGWFTEERHAAFAYNVLAQHHRGEFAYLNSVELTKEEETRVRASIEETERLRQRRKEFAALPPEATPTERPYLCAIDLAEGVGGRWVGRASPHRRVIGDSQRIAVADDGRFPGK